MRRIAIAAILFGLLAPVSLAQSSDAPSREDILKLLDVLHAKRQMGLLIDGMFSEFSRSMAMQMKKKVPNATPEQQKLMDEVAAGVQKDMRSVLNDDDMIELVVPIYQKYLTKREVVMITDFYSTPEGKAFLDKMPLVTRDAMQVGGEYGRSKSAELEQLIHQRMADFEIKLKDLGGKKGRVMELKREPSN